MPGARGLHRHLALILRLVERGGRLTLLAILRLIYSLGRIAAACVVLGKLVLASVRLGYQDGQPKPKKRGSTTK